ncbi:hypothetical protein PMAYCL1PPCAC_19234, partial [Pristionchus mayeri]
LVSCSDLCLPCPRGTYQDERGSATCKRCRENHFTAAPGATGEKESYIFKRITFKGDDNCSWNAICTDFEDDIDEPRFECRCRPGFRGNGTYCSEYGRTLRFSSGLISFSIRDSAECYCADDFYTGERCEQLRIAPPFKVGKLIATIGTIVSIMIVVVVAVIFIIKRRATRV